MIMTLYSVEVEHMDTPYGLSQGNILFAKHANSTSRAEIFQNVV